MDAIFGGGAGGGDAFGGQFPLEQWFFEMPVCTRWWTTAVILTGVLVQCHIVSPFQLFYSFKAVFHRSQVSHKPTYIFTSTHVLTFIHSIGV